MMSRMPFKVARTSFWMSSGFLAIVSSLAKMAWAMLLKYTSAGKMSTLAPAAMAVAVQSGTAAMATAFLAVNCCHTPAGPADWMSKSFLVKPDLLNMPSNA